MIGSCLLAPAPLRAKSVANGFADAAFSCAFFTSSAGNISSAVIGCILSLFSELFTASVIFLPVVLPNSLKSSAESLASAFMFVNPFLYASAIMPGMSSKFNVTTALINAPALLNPSTKNLNNAAKELMIRLTANFAAA